MIFVFADVKIEYFLFKKVFFNKILTFLNKKFGIIKKFNINLNVFQFKPEKSFLLFVFFVELLIYLFKN
ncbi:hypothetical protein C4F40_07685 [Sphingobacterium sp. Ka21]|uniref:Uncharacterized protein n=1 Tax=Sphingobacterium pedocola TaxID=2082722 RepID=A0ABR9T5H8_9SPHI|nr:hypothetical protein [Sphingobacterium pedocola]